MAIHTGEITAITYPCCYRTIEITYNGVKYYLRNDEPYFKIGDQVTFKISTKPDKGGKLRANNIFLACMFRNE